MKWLKFLDQAIEKVSSVLLVIVMIVFFSLSLMGIVGRWVHYSPDWIDPVVRHLVFVSAFLAGILVTGKGKHIGIDLLIKYLEHNPYWHRMLKRVVSLISSVALIWLLKAGLDFLRSEMEFGKAEFLHIHSAFWVAVIPIGFALMSYRFFYIFLATFQKE